MGLTLGYQRLYRKIGYTFKNEANLVVALTHKSASKSHNERLEFLGDAVLGMVIAEELYKRFPKYSEGHLTRMRSSLVKGVTLAEVAREFDLGEYLTLGSGELKSGGARRDSILEDAVESLIGAIYLEVGFEDCRQLVLSWFTSRLNALNPDLVLKDSKTQLQEFLQGRKIPLPDYAVLNITGKDHAQTFEVECCVPSLDKRVAAKGSSRRKAEQDAAKALFEEIKDNGR